MATTDLSAYDPALVPDASGLRFTVIVSDWNREVTHSLYEGTIATLLKHGVKESDIRTIHVPGSFELISAARIALENLNPDAVVCLGCVVQGETPHFTYVCQGVAHGISSLNASYNTSVIFGVLTTDTQQQALDRAGGKHGNKGDEAAYTAIRMASLKRKKGVQ